MVGSKTSVFLPIFYKFLAVNRTYERQTEAGVTSQHWVSFISTSPIKREKHLSGTCGSVCIRLLSCVHSDRQIIRRRDERSSRGQPPGGTKQYIRRVKDKESHEKWFRRRVLDYNELGILRRDRERNLRTAEEESWGNNFYVKKKKDKYQKQAKKL